MIKTRDNVSNKNGTLALILVKEKFLKEEAEPIFEKYKKEVLSKLLENEERLKEQVLKILENITNKANEREDDYKVAHIDFSLLGN